MVRLIGLILLFLLNSCAVKPPVIPIDKRSVDPGSRVTRGGTTALNLLGTPLRVGEPVPGTQLVDTHLRSVGLSDFKGSVLVVSIVPSVDTQVCERQTHLLGEAGEDLPGSIKRISISRDLPFAQQRFAEETGFRNVSFLSDFQQSAFGRATGLLVDEIYLLARSVMVVDREGMVRHLQVVPELSHLPDMERAFAVARSLAPAK